MPFEDHHSNALRAARLAMACALRPLSGPMDDEDVNIALEPFHSLSEELSVALEASMRSAIEVALEVPAREFSNTFNNLVRSAVICYLKGNDHNKARALSVSMLTIHLHGGLTPSLEARLSRVVAGEGIEVFQDGE